MARARRAPPPPSPREELPTLFAFQGKRHAGPASLTRSRKLASAGPLSKIQVMFPQWDDDRALDLTGALQWTATWVVCAGRLPLR